MENVSSKIGNLFTLEREKLGNMSYAQIVSALGKMGYKTNQQQLYRLHEGVLDKPAFQDVMILANFYGISPEDLAQETGFQKKTKEKNLESITTRKARTLFETYLATAIPGEVEWLIQALEAFLLRRRFNANKKLGA